MTAPAPRPSFRDGGFEVTDTLLRTPRKSYRLAQIEYVSVQRPLFLFAGLPSLALIGFSLGFWRYLSPAESMGLISFCVLTIGTSLQFGTLRVYSLALRDDELATSFGPIGRLRRVRGAVERAMIAHNGNAGGAE